MPAIQQWGPPNPQQQPGQPQQQPLPQVPQQQYKTGQGTIGQQPVSPFFQQSATGNNMIGRIDTGELSDQGTGGGQNGAMSMNQGAVQAVQNAQSVNNPADAAANSALRDALYARMGSLSGNAAGQKGELDTQIQRGSQQQMDALRRQSAGTGAFGNQNYGNAQGAIGSQAANARAQGTQAINQDLGNQLNQTGAGLAGVYNQGLQGQQFQNAQAGQYAQLLEQIANQQIGLQNNNAQLSFQQNQANNQWVNGLTQGASMAGGAALMGSDEKIKKNIKPGGKEISSLLDHLNAHSYDYNEPEKFGSGKHVSVMAQELEKHPLGKSMVMDTEEGKIVDYGKGLGVMMAAQSELHKRLKALEGGEQKMSLGGIAGGLGAGFGAGALMYSMNHKKPTDPAAPKLPGANPLADYTPGADGAQNPLLSSNMGASYMAQPDTQVSPFTKANAFGGDGSGLYPQNAGQGPLMSQGGFAENEGGSSDGDYYKKGGKVKGKEVVPGDSELNDVVKARLSAGEIVIPKHIAEHPNAPELGAEFIRGLKSKDGQEAPKMNQGGMCYADGGLVPFQGSMPDYPEKDQDRQNVIKSRLSKMKKGPKHG